MKKGISTFNFFLLSALFFSSCATLFGPNQQKVVIKTESPNDSIYMNNEFKGVGALTIKLKKKFYSTYSFQVKKNGYFDRNYVVLKTQKAPIAYLNIPFYLALYFGKIGDVIDNNNGKGINYNKYHTIPNPTKESKKRKESEKYLTLGNIDLDISENDSSSVFCFQKEFIKNSFLKGRYVKRKDDPYILFDSSALKITTKQFLIKYNYIDTSSFHFSNYGNTVHLSAKIKKLLFYHISPYKDFGYGYVVAEVTTEWILKDFYGGEIKKYYTTRRSDPFAEDPSNPGNNRNGEIRPQIPIQNALNYSLGELFDRKDYVENVELKKETDNNDTPLEIERPLTSNSSLDELIKGAVTVKTSKGFGSGFIISRDGYIISNLHLIGSEEKNLEIIMNDGTKNKAEVVRLSKSHDLVLLKIDKTGLAPFQLSENSEIELGSTVFAIGTPKNIELGQTVSKGVFSAFRKTGNIDLLQTNIKINSGNSGGPLLNKQGQVIGIVTSKLFGIGVEGVSFCIPAKYIFEQLHILYK
jgi:serine protease Do